MKNLLTIIFFFSCDLLIETEEEYLIVEELDGCIGIEGDCYYHGDIDVLQIFIDNSSETVNMNMDHNQNGIIEPSRLEIKNGLMEG